MGYYQFALSDESFICHILYVYVATRRWGKMEKGRVVIKFEQLPKDVQGYHSVFLLNGLLIDEGPEGELVFDEVAYTWNIEADDLRVFAWIGDSDREVGRARNLQEALKIALEDYEDMLEFMPEKKIKVIEE
jgi:hypothetical protein